MRTSGTIISRFDPRRLVAKLGGSLRLVRCFRQNPRVKLALQILVGLVLALALTLIILGPLSSLIAGAPVGRLDPKDEVAALNAVRQLVLATLGGMAAVIGLGFTIRTYYLSRRGQVTERFKSGITLLASDKLEERLGGLFALEHVMVESGQEHSTVIAVLSAFVRTRTLMGDLNTEIVPEAMDNDDRPDIDEELPADIDAAMTIIARRPDRAEPNRPDLRRTRLRCLSVRVHEFSETPRLTGILLTGSDLRRADLRGASLRRSILNRADMRFAWLDNADLSWCAISHVNLRWAKMSGANLEGTRLGGSDLRHVENLTADQISLAFVDNRTKLPEHLQGDPWALARIADCEAWKKDHEGEPWAVPPRTPKPGMPLGDTLSAVDPGPPVSGNEAVTLNGGGDGLLDGL